MRSHGYTKAWVEGIPPQMKQLSNRTVLGVEREAARRRVRAKRALRMAAMRPGADLCRWLRVVRNVLQMSGGDGTVQLCLDGRQS